MSSCSSFFLLVWERVHAIRFHSRFSCVKVRGAAALADPEIAQGFQQRLTVLLRAATIAGDIFGAEPKLIVLFSRAKWLQLFVAPIQLNTLLKISERAIALLPLWLRAWFYWFYTEMGLSQVEDVIMPPYP